jgi:hypothetical protein
MKKWSSNELGAWNGETMKTVSVCTYALLSFIVIVIHQRGTVLPARVCWRGAPSIYNNIPLILILILD